jgi:hypothetical protein
LAQEQRVVVGWRNMISKDWCIRKTYMVEGFVPSEIESDRSEPIDLLHFLSLGAVCLVSFPFLV